jgi:hypothetical protein
MRFIEQLFSVSPDGGDGTLEIAYFIAMLVTVSALVFRLQVLAAFRVCRGSIRALLAGRVSPETIPYRPHRRG